MENVYESTKNMSVETKRLRDFDFLFQKSKEMLGKSFEGRRILDISCGPDTRLNRFIGNQNGIYFGCDIREDFLAEHRKAGLSKNLELVDLRHGSLPYPSQHFDIVHVRNVLMHFPGEQRRKIICETLRVTNRKANLPSGRKKNYTGGRILFFNLDWSAFKGSEAVERFRDFNFSLINMKVLSMELRLGNVLEREIWDVIPESEYGITEVEGQKFEWQCGPHYHELLPLMNSLRSVLEEKRPKLLDLLDAMIASVKKESELSEPPGFTPPTLFYVEVTRSEK